MLKELTLNEFHEFANNHIIGNYYQSLKYALLKVEEGFEYEIIGLIENNQIKAAALILTKKIGNYSYGYSPRGFLIDYKNLELLQKFSLLLKKYYSNKNFAFIKINPEIAIAKLNQKTNKFEPNSNYTIIDNLLKSGYEKLKDNLNFESLLPRFNAILNLSEFDLKKVNKNTRNKINKGIRKGLTLKKADKFGIDILYSLVQKKYPKKEFYFKDKFNIFNKDDSIDLFLVSIDSKQYLLNSQNKYHEELNTNNELNNLISTKFDSNLINKKMNSDRALTAYKNDITEATKLLNEEEIFIAGALVIKYKNRIIFEVTGFDNLYSQFAPNYFLHYAILNYYQKDYQFANLNGVSGDFENETYKGLNRFKLGFNPDIYEYIGEFDLIIDQKAYENLKKNGVLAKEFNKKSQNI
ncbi:MAG: aminoacyltransferase [Firmicutes bacterium]|nr:aminoacyltransferase [Bacillota bacterium]